ncbi:unnamed protein product [Bemisia tabaci]|uniref:Intraflagellar transport protein 80 homolog n=1 Tax=Bemisia tabaci TaxID=7038 RepID=A0A9P0F3E3_BEMTA|nr:unnamed protein product [Bemisia tabaci]
MKLKVLLNRHSDYSGPLVAVGWSTSEEVFFCSDEHVLLKWNLSNKETGKVCEFKNDVRPTGFHAFSKAQTSNKKVGLEQILLTCADGKFLLLGRNGRFEKSVTAHDGAILAGLWNHDGTGFLTAGQDGNLKTWSPSGLLRATILQGGLPVLSAAWGPDSNQILYTQGKSLIIKSLVPNSKPTKWKAHDGLILKVSWSSVNSLIVSGGEDCKYKIWDVYGRQMFSSVVQDYPVMSLAWSSNGEVFAVGFHNAIRLCDKAGWSHYFEKREVGSIYNISWATDGTQLAGACANGDMLVAQIIQRRVEWLNYEAVTISRKVIRFKDATQDVPEKLEFSERVVCMSLNYGYLIVITLSHCQIYRVDHLNTPFAFQLKEGSVSLILQANRNFLLVEKSVISIYSYDGRLVATPKWPNVQNEQLNSANISLSPETVAVRDHTDEKMIHLLEIGSTTAGAPLLHSVEVTDLALNQAGSLTDRHLAFIDKNRDLFLASVTAKGNVSYKVDKLGLMVESILWNSDVNMLCGIQDTTLTVWYFPAVLFIDPRLLRRTVVMKDAGEFGRNPRLESFIRGHIGVRRYDGALVFSAVTPFISMLHSHAATGSWDDALRLCRIAADDTVWACLATMAVHARQLNVAEEAYAAIDQADKVFFLQYVKSIPNQTVQLSEMTLLSGNSQEAEAILLQNGFVFRAVLMNIQIYNWNRALELGSKHKNHLELVLWFRGQYLKSFDKEETNGAFLKYNLEDYEITDEKIKQLMAIEFDKERKSV